MHHKPDSNAADIRVVVFSDAFRHRNGVGAYYADLLGHLEGRLGAAELICPGVTPEGKQQGLPLSLPGDPTQKLCLPGIPKAVRTLRRVRPHIVVLASPGPYGILGLALAKLWGIPVCAGYHTDYSELVSMYWNKLFGRVGAWYLRLLDRVFFRLSKVVVVNSEDMRRAAVRLGAHKTHIVGTPLEPRLLAAPKPHTHDPFGPVMFAGRLAPEKNIEHIIEAARALTDTPFIIAGDGPLCPLVEAAAEELPNLDYRGWLGREALLASFDECEVLVMPSSVESFGTVAMEAMVRRRVVVVSPHCGICQWPELAEGLVVMRAGETLTDALRRLAAMDPAQRAALAAKARQQAERFNQQTLEDWVATLSAQTGTSHGEAAP